MKKAVLGLILIVVVAAVLAFLITGGGALRERWQYSARRSSLRPSVASTSTVKTPVHSQQGDGRGGQAVGGSKSYDWLQSGQSGVEQALDTTSQLELTPEETPAGFVRVSPPESIVAEISREGTSISGDGELTPPHDAPFSKGRIIAYGQKGSFAFGVIAVKLKPEELTEKSLTAFREKRISPSVLAMFRKRDWLIAFGTEGDEPGEMFASPEIVARCVKHYQRRLGLEEINIDDRLKAVWRGISSREDQATRSQPAMNLAPTGKITAISEGIYLGTKHYAHDAIDGDVTTSWTSQWSMPAWLQLKLPTPAYVSAVGVVWGEGSHNQQFSIDVSIDGKTWETVVTTRWSRTDALDFAGRYDNGYRGNTKMVRERFDIPAQSVRYMRLTIHKTQAPSSHIFQAIVHELEMYGGPR